MLAVCLTWSGEWLSPGGFPGLQNRWRVVLRAAVGSTPIHSRLDQQKKGLDLFFLIYCEILVSDMNPNENDIYTPLVSRIMMIDDITWGEAKKGYLARYRGRIYNEDTAAAYDQLAQSLKPLDVTPLFRLHEGRHVVLLMNGVINAKPSAAWVNILLFILTVITVLMAGAIYSFDYDGPLPQDLLGQLRVVLLTLPNGISFAVSLLAILLAHEFGHYLAGRFHKTHVTLPYFIPLPLSPLGTMGAFIQVKEIPKNRRIMLDIGIAGPLSGLVVAIPVLLLGIWLSNVETIPAVVGDNQALSLEGNSLLYLGLKYLVKGELLPAPASYGDLPAWLYWVRYLFTGTPLPLGGRDIIMHPIAWAGWAGLLVTALNLIPAGQLDGGHILFVLLGQKSSRLVPAIIAILFGLGFFWSGWWLWAMLIFLFGRSHMEPLDLITPLDPLRKWMAVLAVVVFILVFMPVPMVSFSGGF
jgi:membrane-associated protease RseP (regulator of RpoE activity)